MEPAGGDRRLQIPKVQAHSLCADDELLKLMVE